jgi:hypothetical protein
MNETMGNQHPSNEIGLGWLAGIIDGEGCFQLARQKYGNRQQHYRPQISIGNNNTLIIDECVRIAKENGMATYVLSRKAPQPHQADRYVIQIVGLQRCKKWVEVIEPYLIGKKLQSEIMGRYINYRLSIPHADLVNPRINTWGDVDHEYRRKMDVANARHNSKAGQRLNAGQEQ